MLQVQYFLTHQDSCGSGTPFRVVDEINQGMHPRNERMVRSRMIVHSRMVDIACAKHTSQYLLVKPKLRPNLAYHPNLKVHSIASDDCEHTEDSSSQPERQPTPDDGVSNLPNKQMKEQAIFNHIRAPNVITDSNNPKTNPRPPHRTKLFPPQRQSLRKKPTTPSILTTGSKRLNSVPDCLII